MSEAFESITAILILKLDRVEKTQYNVILAQKGHQKYLNNLAFRQNLINLERFEAQNGPKCVKEISDLELLKVSSKD